MKRFSLLIGSTLLFLAATNYAQVVNWDFNTVDGGWTPAVESGSPPFSNQWQWSSPDAAWSVFGNNSSVMTLTSPVVILDTGGWVTFTIHHLFKFERDSDGGYFRTRIDGGAWTAATNTNISGTQYNDLDGVSGLSDDPEAFTGVSLGHPSGAFVTSVLDLGSLAAGQTVQMQFRAGWDSSFVESGPNWEIDSVAMNVIPEPQYGGAVVIGLICLMVSRWRLARRRSADHA